MDIWMAASSTGNPYMDLLVDHVRRPGVRVRDGVEPQGTIFSEAISSGPPDVLHLHWLNVFFLRGGSGALRPFRVAERTAGYVGLLTALRAVGTRIVWTAHNLGNHEGEMALADTICHAATARLADAIIAHSPRARRRVVEALPVGRPQKVQVVPHGHYVGAYPDSVSRSEARNHLDLRDDDRVLLFTGRIRPYKNVPELIRTFSRTASSERDRLVVAGSVDEKGLRDRVVSAAETDDRVELYLKFIPDENLQYYLRAADAVVLPYESILTSGTAVLAMSFERPVVAPRLGTIPDILGDRGGILYTPGAFGSALRRALTADADALAELGRRNRERALEWDWERVADATLEAYARSGA